MCLGELVAAGDAVESAILQKPRTGLVKPERDIICDALLTKVQNPLIITDSRINSRFTSGTDLLDVIIQILVNAINQADSSVFGSSKFSLDSSVIKANVLKSTGLLHATVSVDGKDVNVTGDMTTSYWAKTGPGKTTYKFAIGGTDSDYQKAWASILKK